jgi:hypothetical protein
MFSLVVKRYSGYMKEYFAENIRLEPCVMGVDVSTEVFLSPLLDSLIR